MQMMQNMPETSSITRSSPTRRDSAGTLPVGNERFLNALARQPQSVPPIWMMRQAGRYHRHYRALRAKHPFMDLCKQPELAAEVALGPVEDFDFDAAILFSDLLFPLEALGMGLEYTDSGPQLGWNLDENSFSRLRSPEDAWPHLLFQGEAVRATRERLPADRSLLGFVGGPWTLFVYAIEGSHKGPLASSKSLLSLFRLFCETAVPLLKRNIGLQLANGAELVMIFDTAAGELAPDVFRREVLPQLESITSDEGGRIGYYSKGTQPAYFRKSFLTEGALAGVGIDHRWEISEALEIFRHGFVQGNFDQTLLLCERNQLRRYLVRYLEVMKDQDCDGWICGLGHGVLPGTPEDNVRLFVETVREVLQ